MSINTLWTCDRCKATAEEGAWSPSEPEGWGIWTLDTQMHICPDCREEVRQFITAGRLAHIGHARQSGSGKSWTELSLDRQTDPERWFPVYAFTKQRGPLGKNQMFVASEAPSAESGGA